MARQARDSFISHLPFRLVCLGDSASAMIDVLKSFTVVLTINCLSLTPAAFESGSKSQKQRLQPSPSFPQPIEMQAQ